MTRSKSIQRLWTTKIRPHSPTWTHLSANAWYRTNLHVPLEHPRRSSQYEASPTRLAIQDQANINAYLAVSDDNSAVAKFLDSVTFIRAITGHKFVDGHLLLQALYGDGGSDLPHQRLAMLGDVLLQYILKDDWFQLGLSTRRIGEMAARVATNANLAKVAKETGLLKHLSTLDRSSKTNKADHPLGTVVEALLGAIHEDSGKDMNAVRRAMNQMGLRLPEWYRAGLISDRPDLRKARSKLDRPRAKKRLELLARRQDTVDQGLAEHSDSDRGGLYFRYHPTEEQATSDGDFEALDAARARLDDMGTDEERFEGYDIEHDILEDANSMKAYLEDPDADQPGLETPATRRERIGSTAAELTSSSWKAVMRGSSGSPVETETAQRQGSARLPTADFDSAIGAFMIESDGSLEDREIAGEPTWPVRHGWAPQQCQITLDVALSNKPIQRRD